MNPNIRHLKFESLQEVVRGRGIVNRPIASKSIGARQLHSGITHIPPRTSVPEHSHNAEEQVTVLEGTMKIILNGEQEVICNVYDSTFLSPGVKHELINETEKEVVAMVIYGSANVNREFSATGEVVEIGGESDKFTAEK